jgi:hypothetical protein
MNRLVYLVNIIASSFHYLLCGSCLADQIGQNAKAVGGG